MAFVVLSEDQLGASVFEKSDTSFTDARGSIRLKCTLGPIHTRLFEDATATFEVPEIMRPSPLVLEEDAMVINPDLMKDDTFYQFTYKDEQLLVQKTSDGKIKIYEILE